MTGQEFDKIFDQKTDHAFSGFLNPVKKNRLFKEAIFTAIEKKYTTLAQQKVYDELSFPIRTNKVFPVNNNQIYVNALQIVNIFQFFFAAMSVTTKLPMNLIVGDTVTFSGIEGSNAPNGTFNVSSILSKFKFAVALIAPVSVFSFTQGTGKVIYDKLIDDYMHLLTIKTKFTQIITNINITDASKQTPVIITVDKQNNLRTGEEIEIKSVIGNTAANGVFFIKKLNSKKFSLFSDKKLTTSISGDNPYVSGGTISRVFYNYCKPFFSDRKIGVYGQPTVSNPKFEIADNFIKLYPLDETAEEITIDYISKDIVLIDVNDNKTDLELFYPEKFLFYIMTVAAELFSESIKDQELLQTSLTETQINP